MGSYSVVRGAILSRRIACTVVAVISAVVPCVGAAEIIWSGNYETGNFVQWHKPHDANSVAFFQVPEYGRPIQYGKQKQDHVGNGELLSLVAATERAVDGIFYPKGPTRGTSEYAAKFTVKSLSNGVEPDDCDKDACRRRRTELTVQSTLPLFYRALPYRSERWLSVSHFVPEDWDNSGSGWGPQVFQVKARVDGGGIGSCLSIHMNGGEWQFAHKWTDIEDFRSSIPWQQAPKYSSTYPKADGSDSGADLRGDFPDQAASQAALADLNKGGWTDWVMHIVFDARGKADGGRGILEVWKRADSGPWVKVLKIVPKKVTVGGRTYDRGICFNSPDGFGIKAGMYMEKEQVWGLKADRVLYNANIKVGSASTKFEDMSPDGSAPGSEPQEEAPEDEAPEDEAPQEEMPPPPPKPPELMN